MSDCDRELVKSSVDGRWYYKKTRWKYVLDDLCDCLGYFSEVDKSSEFYRSIDFIADKLFEFIEKNG